MSSAYLTRDMNEVVGLYRCDGTDLIDSAGGEAFTVTGTIAYPPCGRN